MALTNAERVGKGLDLLRDGLVPFVEREMRANYRDKWRDIARTRLHSDDNVPEQGGPETWDIQVVLILMDKFWNDVFKRVLGHAERNYVFELRNVRNNWAHQNPFSSDDAQRALDTMQRLLSSISAEQAKEIERMRQELLRTIYAEQTRGQRRKLAGTTTEGRPAAGLTRWRSIVTPHPDVSSGRYQQAEFAADLGQVFRGIASAEYGDPKEFFSRTFITEGLRLLLSDAIERFTGMGGNPVVELQTNFGGGKTHSMLALYHLCSGEKPAVLPGVEGLLQELAVQELPEVKRAVLVGTDLSPAEPHREEDGLKVRTLWGEMAWQLGGLDAFSLVAEADEKGVSPGSELLAQLMERYSPCLVLIDEWVAYLRQLYDKQEELSAGSYAANVSFVQSLTEAVKRVPTAMVVASLPQSRIETGGEAGQESLKTLQSTFGRIQSPWRPATAEESFEIVRRRLFQPITEPERFRERDAVIDAYSRFYQDHPGDFPTAVRESSYKRRIEAAYPIHPELFDRLYQDWSSLEKFQRTRGVLRLMAKVIHELWEREDANLLIMPGTVPIQAVQNELISYLADHWVPVIEKDVDGPDSLPRQIDRQNPGTLGRYSAARRVARAIFLGSAPTANAPHPGLDDRAIRLGCVQPGETIATFGDALRRLSDRATYLYADGARYWFSTQPSVTSLAQDRAAQQDGHKVWKELADRLKADRQRGDFAGIHAVPESGAEVADETDARLVILGPEAPHVRQQETSPAIQAAQQILEGRGNSPRNYRNALVFLAPDRARLEDLEQAIRQYLAWKSIVDQQKELNLNEFARSQAQSKCEESDRIVNQRISETYQWLLVPTQPDPKGSIQWSDIRVQGQQPLAVRASRKLQNEEHLITQFSATRLKMELDRHNLWGDQPHINLKKLWEYFATYPYLQRLRDSQVLAEAIQDGINRTTWEENFAYAEAWDEEKQRYVGLTAGKTAGVLINSDTLLVKPEAAKRQWQAERPVVAPGPGPSEDDEIVVGPIPPEEATGDSEPAPPRRFFGSVKLNPTRVTRDIATIANEVVQHLNAQKDTQVDLTLEIVAKLPEGASEDLIRTVTENCRTLKFESHGFEDE